MATGDSRARIITRYESKPVIVVHATFGALLCTFDQFSDIITIHTLFSVGLVGSASALLPMISLAIAVQVETRARIHSCAAARPVLLAPRCVGRGRQRAWLPVRVGSPQALFAVMMKRHRGVLAVLAEVALVVTGLRAGVEVWRLARGEEHDPGAPMTPKTAMVAGKIAERVFESVPSAMLTAATLLAHPDARSLSTLLSVVFACLATAFVATTIVY
jgi:hypothetical protein